MKLKQNKDNLQSFNKNKHEEKKANEIIKEKSPNKNNIFKNKKIKNNSYFYKHKELNKINEISDLEKEIKSQEKKLKKLNYGDFENTNNLAKTTINYRADNTICVFQSFDGNLYLIYANKNKVNNKNNSIISYNLYDCQKMNEIPNAHNEDIDNFRHYFDKYNKRDLIISISSKDNNIKLWNINNLEFILNINNINRVGFLKSACFLNDNNQIFIVTSNYSHSENAKAIKIYDLNGNKIKEIRYPNNNIFYIDTYYDIELKTNYIITGHFGYVKSYDYNNGQKYHKYKEDKHKDNYEHYSIIINKNEDNVNLIETTGNGFIRIWDFHTKELLNKIKVSNNNYDNLYGICLWDNNYLSVGCGNLIKIVDLENEEVINTLVGHNFNVITIKSIKHPKYGECIVSQDLYDGQIKLWINKINKIKYLIDELNKKLKNNYIV